VELPAHAVSPQGVERTRRHFVQPARMCFYARERFTEPRSDAARNLTQPGEHVLLLRDLCLLFSEHVARLAVPRLQPDNVSEPTPVIEPSRTAEALTRSHTSRAICGVSRASAGWPMSLSVRRTRSSETRLRNGDCPS
jgi:hypothetical protein